MPYSARQHAFPHNLTGALSILDNSQFFGHVGENMHFLWWIIVGLIAGWATGKIMRGSGYGVLGDIILGIVGGVIGGWIMRAVGFAGQGGTIYTILVAIAGAVILTAIFRLITGRGVRGGRSDIDRAA